MATQSAAHPVEILLVEDSPGDVRLTMEVLKEAKVWNRVHVASDGEEAWGFLHRKGKFANVPRPDLILLDLNLPRLDGRALLERVKGDADLRRIPVVILTTSQAESDIDRSYELHANAYVSKPVDLDHFLSVVKSVEDFWLTVVRLPSG